MKKWTYFVVLLISYFFILLFCYASISKILDFENFQVQIAQSPLLSAYAGFASYGVIIMELIIVVFLTIPKIRLIGLYASLGIMTAFTVYIYLILNYSDFVPCSCGGILEKMGWTEHLIFNIICIVLSAVNIIIIEKQKSHFLKFGIIMLSVIGFNILLVIYLFYSSENIMKKQNNFVRRFPHHPIIEEKAYDLKYNSYYFAGSSKDKLFLANTTSPFLLLSIKKDLTKVDTIKLIPDQPHIYRAIKTIVTEDHIYMHDGSVPVIYRSQQKDLSGKVYQISYQDVYFDQLIILSPDLFAFRTKSNKTKSLVLGNLKTAKIPRVNLNTEILEKQIDGTFDMMENYFMMIGIADYSIFTAIATRLFLQIEIFKIYLSRKPLTLSAIQDFRLLNSVTEVKK
ncbi:MauE/DoxX family redox-associated membrane protein [Chryseobacterium sp. ISL-6]|uniref:MauE/DoxX family redox-associated membrane protein n=1 Tax=Chryseobacterium sp. ISL-6 TaxID=2819143 RepID=UPI0020363830|nr:MauE/DoxX family redox-associated membrane protein [Chryseobacterium sp. ISL-6]